MKLLAKVLIVLAIFLILSIAAFFIKPFINKTQVKSTQTNASSAPAIQITYSNIEQQLSRTTCQRQVA